MRFPASLRLRDTLFLFIVIALFISLCWPFLRGMGVEVDGALAATGIYLHSPALYSWHFGEYELPLMVLSYLGALEVWLCAPVFAVWGASLYTLRLPTLLLGVGTIVLFWLLLREISNRRAAWFGTLLLATDTSFVMLTAIDFGPVCVQLFLKSAISLLFVRWYRSRRILPFITAWFLLGVALWAKALFIWIAGGMFLGILVAAPRAVQAAFKPKLIAFAALACGLGALPLISYNIAFPLNTFRANAKIVPAAILEKVNVLNRTLDGTLLYGFFTSSEQSPHPGDLSKGFPHLVEQIAEITQSPDSNWTVWAALAALCAVPFLWHTDARKPALYAVVSFASGWLAMASTANAGGAAHHVILLWPMPFLLIAVVASALTPRFSLRPKSQALVTAAVVSVAIASVLVICHYLRDLVQNGPGIRWTNASEQLGTHLSKMKAKYIFIVDWGILESVDLLTEGKLPLLFGDEYVQPLDPIRLAALQNLMAQPDTLFVTHPPELEQIPGRTQALETFARKAGLQTENLALIKDEYGRNIFQISRYHP